MNPFFLKLLQSPDSGKSLQESVTATLTDEINQYPLVDGVPILLPIQNIKDGEFDYREHYEKDAEVFDYFEGYSVVHQEENRRLHQQISSEIPTDATTILDVGCGGAWLAKEWIPKGKQVISMDISTINPIRAHKEIAHENHLGLVADVFHLPIQDNALDCIVASEIIEHVQDPKAFVAALFKALKPGGKLIITTPHNEAIQKSLCIHCNQLTPHNAHLHSFTENVIKKIAPTEATSISTRTFNSKLLTHLHLHLKIRFLSFKFWKVVDGFCNALFPMKTQRLMMLIIK